MKWYITPQNIELATWNTSVPATYKPHVSFSEVEPEGKLIIEDMTIYPLVDSVPTVENNQQLENREIVINGDTANAVYTVVEKTFDYVQSQFIQQVNQKRKDVEQAGLLFNGIHVSTDDKTQWRVDQIVGAYNDANITGEIDFQLDEVTFIAVTEEMIRGIKAAGAQHIQQCFSNAKNLITLVLAASSIEDLEEIDVDAGWPTY